MAIPTQSPKAVCEETPLPNCGPGQQKKMSTDSYGCPKYICECKPLSECDPTKKFPLPLEPGMKVITDSSGCCPTTSLICDKTLCKPKLKDCKEKFYEVVKEISKNDKQCCEEYKCVPPKDKCIVEIDGEKYLKSPGEKWPTKDNCLTKECSFDNSGKLQIKEIKEVCDVRCELVSILFYS